MKGKRRLFLALPIPQDLKKEILARRSDTGLNLKWIPEANLHVTVLFLGYVEEESINELQQKVRNVAENTSPFLLQFQSIKFQKGKFHQMIWVTFERSLSFENLARELSIILNCEANKKAIPHINLVRSKEKIHSESLPLDFNVKLELPVDYFELWESHLSPHGATYSSIDKFSLKA